MSPLSRLRRSDELTLAASWLRTTIGLLDDMTKRGVVNLDVLARRVSILEAAADIIERHAGEHAVAETGASDAAA